MGAFSPIATAQEPASIDDLVSSNEALTAEQRGRIAAYAEHWSRALLSEDMSTARLARRKLREPFRAPGIRRIFRDEYGRAAIPALAEVIESDNTFAAVNAIQMVAEFANEQALSVMRERCNVSTEPRWQVRLWGARGLGRVAREAGDAVSPRTLDAAVRDLQRAGEQEEHWIVLHRQFEALAGIPTQRSRDSQIALLSTTLERIAAADGPSDLMQAVHRSLVLLRDQYIDSDLGAAERRQLGTDFAPLLGQVFDIGMLHWESAKGDEDVEASYEGAIGVAESVLALIDMQVRGSDSPRTDLASAWGANNRPNFEADVRRWQVVLDNPPYVVQR